MSTSSVYSEKLRALQSPGRSPERTSSADGVFVTNVRLRIFLLSFALLFFDFYLTAQTRRLQTARLNQDLGEIARREIENAQLEAQKRAQSAQNQGIDS